MTRDEPYEIEIRTSNYAHPERKHGQHVNGPASLFLRRVGGPWYRVPFTRSPHVVRALIDMFGLDVLLATYCHLIEEPKT